MRRGSARFALEVAGAVAYVAAWVALSVAAVMFL